MVEYSSPNTNKPLHLGHVRNNLLGYSVAEIIKASGRKVYKTQVINDRGIHICKSMLAWQKFGNGETPQSTGLKGDKLVGKYYIEFYKRDRKIDEIVGTRDTIDGQPGLSPDELVVLTSGEARAFEHTADVQGATRTLHAVTFPYHDASGAPVGLVGDWRDTTER